MLAEKRRKIGYDGPCPPHEKHRYYFRVYALDKMLNFSGEVATYERKYL